MARTISQDLIEQELAELKGNIVCDSPRMEEEWPRYLPNITPKELLASFSQLPGEPRIRLCFLPADSEHGAFASVTVSDKTAQMASIEKGPYYLSADVSDDHIKLHKCSVNEEQQGQHIAKKLLGGLRDAALTMGKKKITLSATNTGGYAWARFGFAPINMSAWDGVKEALTFYQLNNDITRFDGRFNTVNSAAFSTSLPGGFSFTPQETRMLKKILASGEPHDIYLLSDMDRIVGNTKDARQHPITVGKALLCDMPWSGVLSLKEGDPGYERFCNYIGSALVKNRTESRGVAG